MFSGSVALKANIVVATIEIPDTTVVSANNKAYRGPRDMQGGHTFYDRDDRGDGGYYLQRSVGSSATITSLWLLVNIIYYRG